jgi:MOSC domain-containing protein
VARTVGTVEGIWRYPVKSLGGERLTGVDVDVRGLAGDRWWAVRDADGKFGSGKTTRRFRRMAGLLELSARDTGGVPEVRGPDGEPVPDADAFLRAYLGRDDVGLAAEGAVSHFDELPVSLLATATLDWARTALPGVTVDERRFRPNLVVRTPPGTPPFVEDTWLGHTATVGGVRLDLVRASVRCVMVNEAQPGLEHDAAVLRTIARCHATTLAALATVTRPGHVRAGDAVVLGQRARLPATTIH